MWSRNLCPRLLGILHADRGVLDDIEQSTAAIVPGARLQGRLGSRGVLLERLRTEMEGLPEKLRRVLQLSIVEDMDAAAVAAVLGIPAGTVASRLHAARKLLLEVMK